MNYKEVFSLKKLEHILPRERANDFFKALLGSSKDGAYDISLSYVDCSKAELEFEFLLKQRTGKCLTCSLTYGLPYVFTKHPILNTKEIVQKICSTIQVRLINWQLGNTIHQTETIHTIPLTIQFEKK